ncbi:uncharacterized protein LOC119768689 [Culex quinquefasciatus]|uniref:uncharacterized protein LOC119768689 n=1 Tax=Culex quinquefasciatus TaxID=7176 RepID=UPI0018E3186B|nr:uncharacterized protein LOC119768689 [Culex quinquefasciatus]
MFLESLTISGFAPIDDRSFRFEPTLNYFPDQPACEILDWFLNGRTAHQLDGYSEAAYVEVRLRSDSNDVGDCFAQLRGDKSRAGENNRICLHRAMARPERVLIDGKSSLPYDKFRFEMEQLGLIVRTGSWPTSVNVVGPQEMAERIVSGTCLMVLVRECFNVDMLRMQAGREQDFKMAFRKKFVNAMFHDVGEKIAEFKDRIESSHVFRKLKATLDAMTRGVVEWELQTIWNGSQLYESQLRSLVEERELLSEKEDVLRKQIDREQSVTNSVLQLLSDDVRLTVGEADCAVALTEAQEKSSYFNAALQQKIETALKTLHDKVDRVLEGNAERFRMYEQLVQNECELELAENCLHLQYLPAKEKNEELEKVAGTLQKQLEAAKQLVEIQRESVEKFNETVQQSRSFLAIPDNDSHATRIREGRSMIEQLAKTAQKDLEEKMKAFWLNKQLLEHETTVTDSVNLSECLSLESIQALAHLRHVLGTTQDDHLRTNLVGFAYKHLKFSDSTVSKLILPQLELVYTLTIFKTVESVQTLMNLLSRKHSYNLLATETFRPDDIPTPSLPNLQPLADYLVDSPLKPILSQVLKPFFCCTKAPYSEIANKLAPGTTVIFPEEDIVINADGLIVYGHPPCVEFLADTLINCVELSVDANDIRRQLRDLRNVSAEKRRVMEQMVADLVAAERDEFERFEPLKNSSLTWSALPSSLEQLLRGQLKLIARRSRVASWTTLLERINKREFEGVEVCRVDEAFREKFQRELKAFDRQLAELKGDLRSLRELLVLFEGLREARLDPELHKLLVTYWREYRNQLNDALETVGNELESCDRFAVSDELDHLERESVQVHQQLLTVNDRLQGLDRHYRELRVEAKERLKEMKPGKSIFKQGTLQKLYESKRKLYAPDIQPPYSEPELQRFKLKLELLRDRERLASEFRTSHITNLMMPCVEKLGLWKLRLVTQLLGAVPGLLKQQGGQLRLEFEYDRRECLPMEEGTPEMNVFSLQNTIGLGMKFVGDDDPGRGRHPLLDEPALLHLLFFACFLSVQGCKLLILEDCFKDLPDEEKLEFLNLLATIAKNTQIFIGETSNE